MKRKWMVDVKGKASSPENIADVLSGGATEDAVVGFVKSHGNLTESVINHIELLGYKYTDSGGGCGGWHIGAPLEDLIDATNYLNKMTLQFHKAIAAGLLRFELKTWFTENWA